MEETITITIKTVNHKKLAQLKIDKNLKKFDDVLEYLFKKSKI